MPTFPTHTLIDELQRSLREQLNSSRSLKDHSLERLTTRPAPEQWSVMEIMAHMNLSSGHYYRRLQQVYSKPRSGLLYRSTFTAGLIGQWSVKTMTPRPDGTIPSPMRTLHLFDPGKQGKAAEIRSWKPLEEFIAMLEGTHELFEQARIRGLEGEKVTSTLGPIIRFKVGDAFRFPIAHQARHMLQIQRVLHTLKELEAAR